MKIEDLFERVSANLLVVDVQPEYSRYSDRIVGNVCHLLNTHRGKKVVLFNGNEVSNDTKEAVMYYYFEYGLNEENVDQIQFIEKSYGFFRGWMDSGISDSIIIKTIRAMHQQRMYDSRQLIENNLLKYYLSPAECATVEDLADPIYFPDFFSINFLRSLSPFYIMGGGRNECLREIELICNAFNIRHKRIDNLIYG